MKAADFRSLILAQSGMSALVAGRVFPLRIPEEVWDSATQKPCIVYRTSSTNRGATFCGTDELVAETAQVDCYARSYDAAKALGDAVGQVVDFRGIVGETLFGPVFIQTEFDSMDPEPGLFRRTLLLIVWNRSVTP